jgi:three-Cys-motif partner protein
MGVVQELNSAAPPGGGAKKPPSPSPNGTHWNGGGPWTEIKLDAVAYYLECYAKALTPVGFDLWYADAFAGSGARQATRVSGGFFEGGPLQVVTETLAGSARRALAINPPFHHFVFNEKKPERNRALQRLKAENPTRDIRVFDGDANEVMSDIFGAPPWNSPRRKSARGIVFLDPFALQV